MIERQIGTVYDLPNSQDLKIVRLMKFHSEQYALKLQNHSPKIENRTFVFVSFEAIFEHLLVISL